MRWFKHLADTRQDEKVAQMVVKGGAAAYGTWWMVLETIARQMEKGSEKCSVTYPVSKWAVELQTTPCNVRKRLTALVTAGLLQMNCKGSSIELIAPNLLKYRDEWQSRLGSDSGARIQSQSQKQKQIQKTERVARANETGSRKNRNEEAREAEPSYQEMLDRQLARRYGTEFVGSPAGSDGVTSEQPKSE